MQPSAAKSARAAASRSSTVASERSRCVERVRGFPPHQFASGVGMSTTARQLGGSLGIAATASVLAARGVGGPRAYGDVFLVCAVLAAPASAVGVVMAAGTKRPGSCPQA